MYHSHIMDDEVVTALEQNMSHIAHVQIADDPGRHEPGTGSIDFKAVFQALERAKYQGMDRMRIRAFDNDRRKPVMAL